MNTYPAGSGVTFSVAFRAVTTGNYIDPTAVVFKIRTPETGVVTEWTYLAVGSIVRDSLGHYHADYTCDFPGLWYYRWEATGNYVGASERYCCIMDTMF